MINLKKHFYTFAIGGIGGVLLGSFLLPFLASHNIAGLGHLVAFINRPVTVINKIEKETVIVPEKDYFGGSIKKVSSSIVSVQSFSGNRVIRYGSGVILTEDGIIATVNSVVPTGASYQIWIDGSPLKGIVVARDWSNNIALIKVEGSGLGVASLSSNSPEAASSLLMVGELVDLSKARQLIEPAFVTWSDGSSFGFKADYNELLYGAVLIDKDGGAFGIIDFKNRQPVLIGQAILKVFLDSYLEGIADN